MPLSDADRISDDNYLCIGDSICMFCEKSSGYVFSDLTTSDTNVLYTFHGQDREKPTGINNPQIATFRIFAHNRYKLNKIYQELKRLNDRSDANECHVSEELAQAKNDAETEIKDNAAEQRRLRGKPVKYGDVIQLKHEFSNKFIHSTPKRQAEREKRGFLTHLDESNSKTAQFRLLPKYRINQEGDYICDGDHVVLESVKATGHYLQTTDPFLYYDMEERCELVCSVEMNEFTMIKRTDSSETHKCILGGTVLQLNHKNLEAYFCANTKESKQNNVHLHVYKSDPTKPETLYPPQSSATLWQIIPEVNPLRGNTLFWGSHVRLQHFISHRFLYIDKNDDVGLTDDGYSLASVFTLHLMDRHGADSESKVKGQSLDSFRCIRNQSMVRIEHVASGKWLHGVEDTETLTIEEAFDAHPMKSTRKITASFKMMYYDAFCLKSASKQMIANINFIIGISRVLKMTLYQFTEKKELDEVEMRKITSALDELKTFLDEPTETKQQKARKVYVRELKVIDQLVELMKLITSASIVLEWPSLIQTTSSVFMSCVRFDDENSLYVTQYVDFFQKHISMKEGNHTGASMIQIILELIRNRRDVIGTVTRKQIDRIISFFKKYQHHCYLNVLSSLCVCDGKGIGQNQIYIGQQIMNNNKNNLYRFITKDNQVFLIKSGMPAPIPLAVCHAPAYNFHENHPHLLTEQLMLFISLCKDRNQTCIDMLTKEHSYLDWDVVFSVVQATDIPMSIRTLFCQLLIVLYVDVSENSSLLSTMSYTYLYDSLDLLKTPEKWLDQQAVFVEQSLDNKVPKLQHWLHFFLRDSLPLTRQSAERMKLVLQAWNLVYQLIEYGYYSLSKIKHIFPTILQVLKSKEDNCLDGSDTATKYNTMAIIAEVKYRVLLILELALEIQFKYQCEILIATFADAEKGQFSTSNYKKAVNDFLKEYKDKSTLFTWTSPKTEWTKIIESIMKKTPIPIRRLEEILLHLGMVAVRVDKDDSSCDETCVWGRITSKVLLILKNHFERRSRLIQASQKALILMDERNIAKFKDVQMFMPLLSRHTASTMDRNIGQLVCAILNKFKTYCRKESSKDAAQPDPTGQKILLNQGILPVILKLIKTDQMYIGTKEDAGVIELVIGHALELLQDLCKENSLIQEKLYENLELLLKVQYSPKTLAETIELIFKDNWVLSERLDTHEIEQIVHLSFRYENVAPNFLQILKRVIQTDLCGERMNLRAQHVITKMVVDFQAQYGFQVLRMSAAERQDVLLGKHGGDLLTCLLNVTDILSIIAKDQKMSVQLFCSTICSVKEVFSILTHPEICLNVKRPFIKLLHWAFIPSRPDIIRTKSFWDLIQAISNDLHKTEDRISQYGVGVIDGFDAGFYIREDTIPWTGVASDIYYFAEAVLPLLATFSRMCTTQDKHNPRYKEIYKPLVEAIMVLFPKIVKYFKQKCFLSKLTSNIRTIMLGCCYGEEAISDVVCSIEDNFGQLYSSEQDCDPNAQKERELNQKLKTFTHNCRTLNSTKNTIGEQLGCKERKYAQKAYTEIGSGKQLPLSVEFQQHRKAFVSPEHTPTPKKYSKISILIKHLARVASRIDRTCVDNQKLAHSALQILRAMLHNIIVILPADILTSKMKKMKYRIRLQHLQELQDLYISQGLVHVTMTLIGTQNQSIFRESLALLECMLFGTGTNVQNSAMEFFEGSREESLFMVISDFLNYSAELMKERRYVLYKVEKQSNEQRAMHDPHKRKSGLLTIRSVPALRPSRVGITDVDQNTGGHAKPCKAEMDLHEKTLMMNERTVQLILKVVAKLADGCHVGLQDYLREQPDNLKSFNIIAAVTKYLEKTYTFVNCDNVELTVDIFQALAETCLGNQKNRLVVLDNKIVDYINHILKYGCDGHRAIEGVLKLQMALSNLLMSLVEESSPSALQVAKDIAQTLDIGAVLRTMEACHRLEQKLGSIAATVGHRMYIIYTRMMDLLPENGDCKRLDCAEQYQSVIAHYKAKVYSIEIVKDGSLQKVYFPFENAHYLRDDLKRRLKWNVDRSSSTNKIRDFMLWSNIVIKDYYHQEKVLSNFMGRLIVRRRIAWDYLMLIISFLINLYMLVCWIEQDNDSSHRLYITVPRARFDLGYLQDIELALKVIHNVVSLMLLCSYFLAQHPSLPSCRTRDKRLKKDDFSTAVAEGQDHKTHDYTTKLFSPTTAYYIMLSAMSLAGSTVTSYCFAFHLLHIVEVNTLLQGVIKAITKNGKSLLWVAILGFCVLYIYGLLGFAFFRHVFDPNNQLYCRTLYECTATVSTYGLTGLMAEVLSLHAEDNSFLMFLAWAAYQTTFFIFFSTIGLNIIFGIIVDTFSELRDLKWRAEKDMHDVCFICGLPSYDFEHHTKGFYYHTRQEHNMWAYLYYFIYLSSTNRSEYTALDYYVAEQRRRGLSDFFPVDRALSLNSRKENNEDIFVELKRDLAYLKRKQELQDIQRHLEDQGKTQNVWCPLRVEHKPKIGETSDGNEPAQS